MTRKLLARAFAAGALIVTSMTAIASGSPNDVITTAVDELAVALEGRKDELAEDRDALYEVIDGILLPRFDRVYAASRVLGRHWRTADDSQRRRFINAFYGAMLSKYADGVLEFEQDRVEILPLRGDPNENPKRPATVRTFVRLNDGQKVPVNYSLIKRKEDWKIFDVNIEGVSYLTNFRAEVDSEIRSTSLDAVIARLESEGGGGTADAEPASSE
jgi:phospholipid transport system substrate-binding protein